MKPEDKQKIEALIEAGQSDLIDKMVAAKDSSAYLPNDWEFFGLTAANARPAIKAMLADNNDLTNHNARLKDLTTAMSEEMTDLRAQNTRQAEVIEIMTEALEMASGCSLDGLRNKAQQALAKAKEITS